MIPNKTECYILFSRPQGETSLWLSLLTPNNGRLSLLYKGGIKKAVNCRSFQPYQLLWTDSRQGDGGWCRTLEAIQHRPILTGMANWSGLYANELLHRLLPLQQPNTNIFASYHNLVNKLHLANHFNESTKHLAWSLRQFEWQLLQDLGYAPPLTNTEGQSLLPNDRYEWQDEHGWYKTNTGILGQDLLQLIQTDTQPITDSMGLQYSRTFLQHRLTLIIPNLPFAMRQWWLAKQ